MCEHGGGGGGGQGRERGRRVVEGGEQASDGDLGERGTGGVVRGGGMERELGREGGKCTVPRITQRHHSLEHCNGWQYWEFDGGDSA